MRISILVVDDEALIIDMLKRALVDKEIAVVGRESAHEALEYCKANSVDIVLSDIMMPGMDGEKLFYELKKHDPFIQVIMITGYPALESIREMLEAGINDFIVKPFRIEHVREVISECINRLKRWQDLRKELLDHKKSI